VGASLIWANLVAELSYTRVEDQDDTAPLELATDAYNDVHLRLVYGMEFQDNRMELFLNGTKLTDDEQRLHNWFIKDLAPQPGRTIEAGFRILL
jgi:iron complex outermembrane receptor protein